MAVDLITKSEFKVYADIQSTNQDAIIDALIPKVSALVKSYCRRTFVDYVNDPKVEVFNGGEFLLPTETPLLVLISVEYSADYGQTYTELVEYTDYYLDIENEYIKPVSSTEFLTVPNGYRITYLAGYEVLPVELKLAVFDLVKYYMQNDGAVHSTKAPGTNSVQIEYVSTNSLPANIRRVLDLYKENFI